MRRFTIQALMILVLAMGLSFAALRNANEAWAGGLYLLTPSILAMALIGALCGRESSRSGRLGFAVLGSFYFAIAFFGPSESTQPRLPTSMLLRYIHSKAVPADSIAFLSYTTSGMSMSSGSAAPVTWQVMAAPSGNATLRVSGNSTINLSRWGRLLPGAANLEAFQTVGHSLFALIAGLLGTIVAVRFERGRIRLEKPAE